MNDLLKINDFDYLELKLVEEDTIEKFIGIETIIIPKRLTQSDVYKLYVLKEENDYIYVGVTQQSLITRLKSGLKANGKNGYHGYKWKNKKSVNVYVWCFNELNQNEIENIEAELVFIIRQKKNKWPLQQNEIHFNNEFDNGNKIALKVFELIEAYQKN